MDPITLIGLVASIVQLIDATTKVVQYANDAKKSGRERHQLAREASSLLALLTDLNYRLAEAQSTDPWLDAFRSLCSQDGPIDQFREAMVKLANKLKEGHGLEKVTNALRWKFDKDAIKEIFEQIERFKSLLLLAEQKDQSTLLKAIKDQQQDHFKLLAAIEKNTKATEEDMGEIRTVFSNIQDAHRDEERHKILAWLSPLDFAKTQRDFLERRQEGTGEWIFGEQVFKDWLDQAGQTLCCFGMPGAGKTILSSVIINHLEHSFPEDDVSVAYLYCIHKEKESQTPAALLASLLQQLVRQHSAIPSDIKTLYKKSGGRTLGLKEISEQLRLEINRFSKVFLVVDALDECPEENGRSDLMTELRKLELGTHLLFTSRHIHTIENEFKGRARVEIRANEHDIRRYLADQMPRLKVKVDPAFRATIIDSLVTNAQGMFLLPQLHMDALARQNSRGALKSALTKLPERLDDAYDDALLRIRSQNEEDAQLAEQVLTWISCAVRPLTVTEVRHALAIKPEDTELDEDWLPEEDVMVSTCVGLVTIDQESQVIRLVHHTTQEYFARIRQSKFSCADDTIARTCLTYLLFDEFSQEIVIPRRTLSRASRWKRFIFLNTETRPVERKLSAGHPLLGYAIKHWFDHVRENAREPALTLAMKFIDLLVATRLKDTPITILGQHIYPKGAVIHIAAGLDLVKVVRTLVEKAAVDVDSREGSTQTPLTVAARYGCQMVVQFILGHWESNVNSKDKEGKTPLSYAAAHGHDEIVRLLLEQKDIEPDSRGSLGETPLYYAALRGHGKVTELLLNDGRSDVNSRNNYGWTPLMIAACYGHITTVQLLLASYSIDLKARDKDGRSALDIAVRNERESVVLLLLDKLGIEVQLPDQFERKEKLRVLRKQLIAKGAISADIQFLSILEIE